jgi:hypothetical protein
MKKILLTTTLVAFAASASASTDKMYIKAGIGYGIGDKMDIISNDNATTGSKKITGKTLRGFASDLGAGYQFNQTLAMEVFGDFSENKQKQALADKDLADAVGGTAAAQTWIAPGAIYPLVDDTFPSAANQSKVAVTNAKAEFKETSMGLGTKLVARYPLHEKFHVSAGIGAEISGKQLEATYSGTLKKGTAAENYSVKAKSKREWLPVGVATLGGDYIISDGVSLGIAYDFKFNNAKHMNAQRAVKLSAVSSNSDNNITTADSTTDFFADKARMGTASRMNHVFKASVKFDL